MNNYYDILFDFVYFTFKIKACSYGAVEPWLRINSVKVAEEYAKRVINKMQLNREQEL